MREERHGLYVTTERRTGKHDNINAIISQKQEGKAPFQNASESRMTR
jgi:hypothetical protein